MVDKNNNNRFQTCKPAVGGLFAVTILIMAAGCAPGAKQTNAFQINKKLGRGVNIIGYDPIWKSKEHARFKEKHFKIIKDGGFDSVRINLFPFEYMEKKAPYRLKDSWFETADWAVDNALKNGLLVILDMHEFNIMGKDPEGNKEKFLAFWRQVAPHFKDAPQNVLFEILNEPSRKLTLKMWNQYLKEALAIIRESNPTRTVVIGPAFFNSIGVLGKLELPENDHNIIVTIHYYEPQSFTHQGAPWSEENKKLSGIKWLGTKKQRQSIANDFKRAQSWAKKNNRPIFLGEFGAYEKGDMESRARYTAFMARTAEKCGFSWAYWQFDSDFIVYNINRGQWVEPIHNALIPKKMKIF